MQKDLTKNENIYCGNITELIQDSTYNTITIEAGKYLKEPIKLELGTVDDYLTTKNGFIDGKVKVGGREYKTTMLDNAVVIKNGTLTSINNGITLSITTNSGTATIVTNTGNTNVSTNSGSVKIDENLGLVSISDTSQGSLIVKNWQIYVNQDSELLFIPIL